MVELNRIQFEHMEPSMYSTAHSLRAKDAEGQDLGGMEWDSKHIRSILVNPEVQRRGVGRALWDEGQRLAETSQRIPAPKHSADRTAAGDAWAKAVGGKVPRRLR